MKLSMRTQHEWVWVILEMPPFGHAPFCGAVGSPLIAVLVSRPASAPQRGVRRERGVAISS
jgi:hypothetical protein